jgi:hypothetical protein
VVVYRLLFIAHVCAVVLLPLAMVWVQHGAQTPFWFLAGDAYLYQGIAQNAQGVVFSFDGMRATNGFHPLWQLAVRAIVVVTPTPEAALWGTLIASAALVLAGALMLGGAIARMSGSWALAALVVPGVYYLLVGQGLANLGAWAFLDGMEGALAFAVGGALAQAVARGAGPFTLGMLMALLVLTRLDEVFTACALAGALALGARAGKLQTALAALAPVGVGIALFVGWSLWTTGLALPVSGAAKGEGGLLANGWVTLATLFAPLIDLRTALTGYEPDRLSLLGGAFRVVQLWVPALAAVVLIAIIARHFRDKAWAWPVMGLGAGVVLKAAYSFANVNYWHQADWYFAFAVAWMSLATALVLAPLMRGLVPIILAAGIGAFGLLHASLHGQRVLTDPWRAMGAVFWADRGAVQAALEAALPDGVRVLEFGDGMVNAALELPVRHGFVFAGDAQSLDALRAGRLLADAAADGFNVIASYEYLPTPPEAMDWSSEQLRAWLNASALDPRVRGELDDFEFRLIHRHAPSHASFIAFWPTAGRAGSTLIALCKVQPFLFGGGEGGLALCQHLRGLGEFHRLAAVKPGIGQQKLKFADLCL